MTAQVHTSRTYDRLTHCAYLSISELSTFCAHAKGVREYSQHRVASTGSIDAVCTQIHVAATFSIHRYSLLHSRTHTCQHCVVFRELPRKQFGKATTKIQKIKVVRWAMVI